MALRLRGEAWWLRKMVGGTVYDVPWASTPAKRTASGPRLKLSAALGSEGRPHQQELLGKLGLSPAAPEAPVPTLADWWDTYLETYTPAKAASTQAHDVYCSMEVGETTYGQMPLDAIRPMNCLRVLQLRRAMVAANPLRKAPAIVSEGTVQRDRRLLQAIFERAVENDHIARNPWKGIESKPVRLGVTGWSR